MKLHLDTDLGGDPDDACALAMLLGWPDVEITGITTNLDAEGRRAGMVAELLATAERKDIRVARGAGATLAGVRWDPKADDAHNWGKTIQPAPYELDAALDLMEHSLNQGATIVAIGAYTNLALLESRRPGTLRGAPVVVMGGWVEPPADGLPQWGPEKDWNVQCDPEAALVVAENADLTLVTHPVCLKCHLRGSDLPRLRAVGPLGDLLARQSQAHAEEEGMAALAAANPALPPDLLNFHYDPLTCAVAVGWDGAVVEPMRIRPTLQDRILRFHRDPKGRNMKVVVDVDPEAFNETWFSCVERVGMPIYDL